MYLVQQRGLAHNEDFIVGSSIYDELDTKMTWKKCQQINLSAPKRLLKYAQFEQIIAQAEEEGFGEIGKHHNFRKCDMHMKWTSLVGVGSDKARESLAICVGAVSDGPGP